MRPLPLFVFLLVGLVASTASAQREDAPDPETSRLGLLTRNDRIVLEPHLQRGPVALIEFSDDDELPAIIYATYVRAPAEQVADVVSDPTRYPRFMPALDDVTVRSRRRQMLAYDWTWRTAVFTLRGSAIMSQYPAPHGRRDRPWRVEIRNTGGDLGEGRQVWRVYPDGPDRSLLVFSSRLDLRDANWVSRQIGSQRSINRTTNMSIAHVMMMGVRDEAERLAGAPEIDTSGDMPPLRRPDVDIFALRYLLFRGDLVFMNMTGDRLDQVAVLGRLSAPLDPVRQIITDPREFGPALIPGSYANVTGEQADGTIDFEWGIDIPLVGTEGTMRLTDDGSRVMLDATSGALAGGRWLFEPVVYDWGEACVLSFGRFDPADSNWLIRMLVQGTPTFGHGIQAGSQVMVMRAIRNRSRDRHEEIRAAERAERARRQAAARQARRSGATTAEAAAAAEARRERVAAHTRRQLAAARARRAAARREAQRREAEATERAATVTTGDGPPDGEATAEGEPVTARPHQRGTVLRVRPPLPVLRGPLAPHLLRRLQTR